MYTSIHQCLVSRLHHQFPASSWIIKRNSKYDSRQQYHSRFTLRQDAFRNGVKPYNRLHPIRGQAELPTAKSAHSGGINRQNVERLVLTYYNSEVTVSKSEGVSNDTPGTQQTLDEDDDSVI
jgi:hypothetical protein